MGIKSFIENWKRKRAERAEARKRIEELFEKFLLETKPLTPKASKHPEAALYKIIAINKFLRYTISRNYA